LNKEGRKNSVATFNAWPNTNRLQSPRQFLRTVDAFFFDIDGTLLVTRDLVHWNALHHAMLEVYGIDTNIEGLSYHGKTDIKILRMALERKGVQEAEFRKKLPLALAVVCREVGAHTVELETRVCPSIPDLLEQIRGAGRMLAVASGNLEAVGWHKVSAAGLRTFFLTGAFGDEYERRCDIFGRAVELARNVIGSKASICFIGDTPDDILAARHVNASVIAVATGTFSFEELAGFKPDLCCRTCAELLIDTPPDLSGSRLRQLSTSRIVD
jgi:phosphoglycolate phosphatase